jgi:hypothetical protein
MKHNGMEWSGTEWNTNFVPLFGYSVMEWKNLPLHHLESEQNKINYNIFIPIFPLFKKIKLCNNLYLYIIFCLTYILHSI